MARSGYSDTRVSSKVLRVESEIEREILIEPARTRTLCVTFAMKPPYFPDPHARKEGSPYREVQPKPEPESVKLAARPVVVSRPEPQAEEPSVAKPIATLDRESAEATRLEARALLLVDAARHPQRFRARILVLPLTLALWRFPRLFGVLHWLAYPLLLVSAVILVLEVQRIWRRSEL